MGTFMKKNYDEFASKAEKICPGRVYTDYLRRYAYGVDASCYSYLPKVVVKPHNEAEVVELIHLAYHCKSALAPHHSKINSLLFLLQEAYQLYLHQLYLTLLTFPLFVKFLVY